MVKETLHCGDNMPFMQTLEGGSIDLIYSDILYGTGREFAEYKDLKAVKSIIYDFYVPRITEMYRLLKPAGSIYLQMDARINHWLRCILDDIFGYNNFRNQIIWKRRSNPNNSPKKGFPTNSDHILFYTKSKDFTFNTQYKPLSAESIKRYSGKDEKGSFQFMGINAKGYNTFKTLIFEGKEYKGHYSWSQKTLDERIKNGIEIQPNSKGFLSYKSYLHDSKGVAVSDIWEDLINENTNYQNSEIYATKKGLDLMARIINTSSNEGDTCADFFCGSGSFGVAAKRLNRNVIMCDIGAKAINQSRKALQTETNLFNS